MASQHSIGGTARSSGRPFPLNSVTLDGRCPGTQVSQLVPVCPDRLDTTAGLSTTSSRASLTWRKSCIWIVQ